VKQLHPGVVERQVRVGNARGGQRRDREVEGVDHVPAVAERIGDRPGGDQEPAGADQIAGTAGAHVIVARVASDTVTALGGTISFAAAPAKTISNAARARTYPPR
jgi:hypothetical protein